MAILNISEKLEVQPWTINKTSGVHWKESPAEYSDSAVQPFGSKGPAMKLNQLLGSRNPNFLLQVMEICTPFVACDVDSNSGCRG